MIKLKTAEEIKILREGGKRLAFILKQIEKIIKPGVSTQEINDLAYKLAKEGGDYPSVLNYKPEGASRLYPASISVSINDEIVHGIPNENPKILKEGDIVSLDMCLTHKGLITDSTITVPVGRVDVLSQRLIEATRTALNAAIKAAKGGKHLGDIGYAIERVAKANGFTVVEDLCGHGVGYAVHEDPYVPNYGEKGEGGVLKPGMVIAIEPMFSAGGKEIVLDKDGYTFKTKDGSRSAHFEHTIAITNKGAKTLTEI